MFDLISKDIESDSESGSEYSGAGSESVIERKVSFNNEGKMATLEQKQTFVSMCSSILREKFDGNSWALDSFLDNQINLIEDLTDANLEKTLIRLITFNLERKDRKALPENISAVNDIKQRSRIKSVNSKVLVD